MARVGAAARPGFMCWQEGREEALHERGNLPSAFLPSRQNKRILHRLDGADRS
jgi:hypothetical protein